MFYLDTSALVKLVVAEPETRALEAWIEAGTSALMTSDLARVELVRAVRRVVPERARDARVVLDSLAIITVTSATYDDAARLEPAELRSLDAVHLAVALELGDSLGGLVTYDHRLAAAAASYGIEVVAPR